MTGNRKPNERPSLGWRVVRRLIRRELRRTCQRHLGNRTLRHANGDGLRWLPDDIERFLATLDRTAGEMREIAELQDRKSVV